jgi:ubiquinone/menaquinone biosynthesis C-methylase UbiE
LWLRRAIRLALSFQNTQLTGFQAVLADSNWDVSRCPVMITKEDMKHAASEKAYKGFGMEGFTARWYASLTCKSLDEFKSLARRVADQIPPGTHVLEVAPGPGYFAIELAKLGGYRVTGLDISHTFVEIAGRNAKQAGVDVDFQQGNAASMPFQSKSFDFLLCRAAFKNFTQPVRALEEMYRVLKPGGLALIIDLRKDASPACVREAVDGMGLGRINTFITKLTFRFMLLKRAYTRNDFEQFLSQTKFSRVAIKQDLNGPGSINAASK